MVAAAFGLWIEGFAGYWHFEEYAVGCFLDFDAV